MELFLAPLNHQCLPRVPTIFKLAKASPWEVIKNMKDQIKNVKITINKVISRDHITSMRKIKTSIGWENKWKKNSRCWQKKEGKLDKLGGYFQVKKEGVLQIKNCELFNIALLSKWLWQFLYYWVWHIMLLKDDLSNSELA